MGERIGLKLPGSLLESRKEYPVSDLFRVFSTDVEIDNLRSHALSVHRVLATDGGSVLSAIANLGKGLNHRPYTQPFDLQFLHAAQLAVSPLLVYQHLESLRPPLS
jgi:hypothetical protein